MKKSPEFILSAEERERPQRHLEFTFTDKELKSLIEQREKEGKLAETEVVVIDVIRFTSNATAALEAGAEKIIPVTSPEEAFRVAEELRQSGQEVVVAAERGGSIVPGAERGNSPRYEPNEMAGKVLVISTSHGTHTVQAAEGAGETILADMRNAKAVADYLKTKNKDIILATSGSKYPSRDKEVVPPSAKPATKFDETIASKDDVLVAARIAEGLLKESSNFQIPQEQVWLGGKGEPQESKTHPGEPVKFRPRQMVEKLTSFLDRVGEKEALEKTRWAQRILWIDTRDKTRSNQEDLEYLSQFGVSEVIPVVKDSGEIVALENKG